MGVRSMMKRAGDVQSAVMVTEAGQRHLNEPPDAEAARQDVRYIRQDLVLLSSQVAQTYGMLLSIRRLGIASG